MDTSSSYPDSIDDLTNPTASDFQNSNSVPHADLHAKVNNVLEAIEAELGAAPSGSYDTVKDRLDAIDNTVTAINASFFGSIPDGIVSTVKLANGAVTTIKIADQQVTSDKLASGAVTNSKIEALAVTGDKIATHTVTYDNFQTLVKIHLKRPSDNTQSIPSATPTLITWTNEISDPYAFTSATPATPTTAYATPVSTMQVPASSTYNGVYDISVNIKGFKSTSTDYIDIKILDSGDSLIDQFFAPVGGSTTYAAVSSLSHIIDLQQSYKVQVEAYNGDSTPVSLYGDIYMVKRGN